LIRSGIDPSEFAPRPPGRNRVRKELGVHADDILVGSVACLKPQKSPLDFVAAAEEAGRDNPRLRFVLAGDGELRTLVEAAARDSVLGERFRLLGWRRDIPDLLSALDVFVLTSRFEGLPRAVLQAMVAGVPVVATAVGGTPEVVENGTTGLLVAPDAPSEVARAVSLLGGDPALRHRLAAAARSRVDEQFDIRRMVRTLDDLYAELLSEITLVGTARERG